MARQTEIAWCDSTFNPWIGCTKVSPGCAHCYAERDFDLRKHVAKWGAGQPRHRTSVEYWRQPLRWQRDAAARELDHEAETNLGKDLGVYQRPRVFCASLADVFDPEVPASWRRDFFFTVTQCHSLDFLICTKRPELVVEQIKEISTGPVAHWDLWGDWQLSGGLPNVWLGTTVEDQARADERIPALLSIPARVRFLSCEPLLGPVDLSEWIEPFVRCGSCGECYDLDEVVPDPDGHPHGADQCSKCGVKNCMCSYEGTAARVRWENGDVTKPDIDGTNPTIDWVICGGESGPNARPMHPDWARSLRDQCATASVPFFFKQWGESIPRDQVPAQPLTDMHNGTLVEPAEWTMPGKGFRDCPMLRVGKLAAGRLLDGREHNEFPEVR